MLTLGEALAFASWPAFLVVLADIVPTFACRRPHANQDDHSASVLSVKSLTTLPTVLQMMSEKHDWTQRLGDTFLAQHHDLMATIQTRRPPASRSTETHE
jgi:hypothetical protein